MKLEDLKVDVVATIVNCDHIVNLEDYGARDEKMIPRIMSSFQYVETGILQAVTEVVSVKAMIKKAGNHGGRLIDIWKEVCHSAVWGNKETKLIGSEIKQHVYDLYTTMKTTTRVEDDNAREMAVLMKAMHQKPFIIFQGNEPYLGQHNPSIPDDDDGEWLFIKDWLTGGTLTNKRLRLIQVLSLIHRSNYQKEHAKNLVKPDAWEAFLKMDNRTRGVVLSNIIEEIINDSKVTDQPMKEPFNFKPMMDFIINHFDPKPEPECIHEGESVLKEVNTKLLRGIIEKEGYKVWDRMKNPGGNEQCMMRILKGREPRPEAEPMYLVCEASGLKLKVNNSEEIRKKIQEWRDAQKPKGEEVSEFTLCTRFTSTTGLHEAYLDTEKDTLKIYFTPYNGDTEIRCDLLRVQRNEYEDIVGLYREAIKSGDLLTWQDWLLQRKL